MGEAEVEVTMRGGATVYYEELADRIINGYRIDSKEAELLINCSDGEVFLLGASANKIKSHFLGNKVKLCAIVNAKSGACSENCSFCAQSAHNKSDVQQYQLKDENSIVDTAIQAVKKGSTCFSIVTSGKGIMSSVEMEVIENSLSRIASDVVVNPCASLGIMNTEQLKRLKKAGLKRFHHNLETAESFFRHMCSTHTYQDRVATVKAAKNAGLEVCCGGIFGIGETPEQRVELAFALRELEVDSVPLNILNPIKGTRLENSSSLAPLDAIRLIAVYRFVLPEIEIGLIGGRESQLGDLQVFALVSGASTILAGNYLTTSGRNPGLDLKMISDLGLRVQEVADG